ncbi:hypothetical protein GCM10028805_39420 [Spirosoma harenae]
MEASIYQNGNNLTGQIKISSKYGFAIEKFTGKIEENRVFMNEYEVVQQYSPTNMGWCLKNLEGTLESNLTQNKRTIEGMWTSGRVYENSTYMNSSCRPGTFIISQPLPPKPQVPSAPLESEVEGRVFDKQTRKPVRTTLSIIGDYLLCKQFRHAMMVTINSKHQSMI